jgi:hypothetical protein
MMAGEDAGAAEKADLQRIFCLCFILLLHVEILKRMANGRGRAYRRSGRCSFVGGCRFRVLQVLGEQVTLGRRPARNAQPQTY